MSASAKSTKQLTTDELDLAFALARGREAGLVADAKPETIIYYVHETMFQSIGRDLFTLATFVVLIGVGKWIDSGVMQWVGATMAFLVIASMVKGSTKRMTPAEIRADLDRIEGRL